MSKVAITGNAAGTGVFTVASPNSNVDRVLTLPDETGTVDTLQRSGNVVQVVNFQTGIYASGTTTTPISNSIPTTSQGTQFMSLAITPTSASNILIISVSTFLSSSSPAEYITTALHIDSVSNAIAATLHEQAAANYPNIGVLSHYMVAGSTSLLTFKVRAGSNGASTLGFNGRSGSGLFGGVAASSITITEYTA